MLPWIHSPFLPGDGTSGFELKKKDYNSQTLLQLNFVAQFCSEEVSCGSSRESSLKGSSLSPIIPFPLHPLFHSAVWKADVIAGIPATVLDHEDVDNSLEMGLQEAGVPKDLEEQEFYSRPGHLHGEYQMRKKSTSRSFKPLSLAAELHPK